MCGKTDITKKKETFLHVELKMTSPCAKMVMTNLTRQQKNNRKNICSQPHLLNNVIIYDQQGFSSKIDARGNSSVFMIKWVPEGKNWERPDL